MAEFFHGTGLLQAQEIITNRIDLTQGGGELGQGFYTTETDFIAFAWAEKRYGPANMRVLEFSMADDDFYEMNPICLDYAESVAARSMIKRMGTTRTYLFDRHIVWSEIVGVEPSVYGSQCKFESQHSVDILEETPAVVHR